MTPTLEEQIDAGRKHIMSEAEARDQIISFAYGNLKLHPDITRESVREEARLLWRKRYVAQPSIPEKTTPSPEALAAMAQLADAEKRWPCFVQTCLQHKTPADPHSGNAGGLRLDSGS